MGKTLPHRLQQDKWSLPIYLVGILISQWLIQLYEKSQYSPDTRPGLWVRLNQVDAVGCGVLTYKKCLCKLLDTNVYYLTLITVNALHQVFPITHMLTFLTCMHQLLSIHFSSYFTQNILTSLRTCFYAIFFYAILLLFLLSYSHVFELFFNLK